MVIDAIQLGKLDRLGYWRSISLLSSQDFLGIK
jgi:hypothetical protein